MRKNYSVEEGGGKRSRGQHKQTYGCRNDMIV